MNLDEKLIKNLQNTIQRHLLEVEARPNFCVEEEYEKFLSTMTYFAVATLAKNAALAVPEGRLEAYIEAVKEDIIQQYTDEVDNVQDMWKKSIINDVLQRVRN